jgi:SpoVK/Ycf46/Vps4 family AAA+-type ATPase
MLGRRGKDTEHSAMRKLKNEFMASWDGLRTRERERVLVLAATNRPFDLDDAVIRRFPRRSLLFISCLFFHLLSMESLEFQSKP